MTKAPERNIAFGSVNAYVVLVQNKHAPTDEEWSEWLQTHADRGTVNGVSTCILAVTEGGIPSPAQRKELQDALIPILANHPTALRIAIVSPSTFVGGFVAALNFTTPMFRAFSSDDMEGAYAHLGIPPAYVDEIEALIATLKAQLRR